MARKWWPPRKLTQACMTTEPIAVLVADDHAVVREGICRMLELEKDFAVVGEAENGRQAVRLAARLRPKVVLMDIAMPLLNGLEATRQILKATPHQRVLILSAYGDDAYVQSARQAGAAGFLVKQTLFLQVCRAIREVTQGRTVFSPAVSRRLNRLQAGTSHRGGKPDCLAVQLTAQEMETLQLVAEGQANKEIAAHLGISIKTVEKHREHLMKKLDLHDTAGITRYAIAAGIIESSMPLARL